MRPARPTIINLNARKDPTAMRIATLLGRPRRATVTDLYPTVDHDTAVILAIPTTPLQSTVRKGRHVRDADEAFDSNRAAGVTGDDAA